MFLMLLILFHVVLFWGLEEWLRDEDDCGVTQPIEAEIINEVLPRSRRHRRRQSKMEIPPVEVPPPVVDIVISPDAAADHRASERHRSPDAAAAAGAGRHDRRGPRCR